MLASPVADEAAALARMPPPVWVEDKYDGIRAQLHKPRRRGTAVQPRPARHQRAVPGGRSRRQRSAVGRHPRRRGARLARRQALPFLMLQARLGRKDPSEQIQQEVPTIFVAFDLLAHRPAGDSAAPIEPLLRLPLRDPPRAARISWALPTGSGSGSRTSSPRPTRRALRRSSRRPSNAATRA